MSSKAPTPREIKDHCFRQAVTTSHLRPCVKTAGKSGIAPLCCTTVLLSFAAAMAFLSTVLAQDRF